MPGAGTRIIPFWLCRESTPSSQPGGMAGLFMRRETCSNAVLNAAPTDDASSYYHAFTARRAIVVPVDAVAAADVAPVDRPAVAVAEIAKLHATG